MTRQRWERETLERGEMHGNPLGWKPHGRDAQGNARLRAVWTLPNGDTKISLLTITERGHVYSGRVIASG